MIFKRALIFMYLCSCFGWTQTRPAIKDSLQIITLLTEQKNAWNQGNIDLFMEGYLQSEKLVFSGAGGPVYGWNNTRDRYKKNYPDKETMGTLQFEFLSMQQLDKRIMQLQGAYYLERTQKANSSGFFTLILKKVDQNWLIVSDHTSARNP